MLYDEGDGVQKDLVQAHVWFNIAGAAGNENAKKNLAIVEKEMTPDQKAESMKLARELFARLPKKNLAILEKQMTTEQKAEAMKFARD